MSPPPKFAPRHPSMRSCTPPCRRLPTSPPTHPRARRSTARATLGLSRGHRLRRSSALQRGFGCSVRAGIRRRARVPRSMFALRPASRESVVRAEASRAASPPPHAKGCARAREGALARAASRSLAGRVCSKRACACASGGETCAGLGLRSKRQAPLEVPFETPLERPLARHNGAFRHA